MHELALVVLFPHLDSLAKVDGFLEKALGGQLVMAGALGILWGARVSFDAQVTRGPAALNREGKERGL